MTQSTAAWEKEKKEWEERTKALNAEIETLKKARTEVTQAAVNTPAPSTQSSFLSQISQLPGGANSYYGVAPTPVHQVPLAQATQQAQQPVLQSVGASSNPTELTLPKGWSIAQRSEKQKELAAGWGINQLPAARDNTASGLTLARFNGFEGMKANAKRFQ